MVKEKKEKPIKVVKKAIGIILGEGKSKSVKIKKSASKVKKISTTSLLKQFANLDYGGVKEIKQYEPANDNRSLFFKQAWNNAQ